MKNIIIVLLLALMALPALTSAQEKPAEEVIKEALALKEAGKLQVGIDLMKEWLDNNQPTADAYLQYGLLLGALGQETMSLEAINGAFAALDKAIEVDPEHFQTRLNYGMWGVYVPPFFNRFNAGVTHLEKAMKMLDSGLHENVHELKLQILNGLGQGYFLQKEYEKSAEAYTDVLYMAPESEAANQAKKGLLALKRTQMIEAEQTRQTGNESVSEEAAALLKKLEADPENFEHLFELGRVYHKEKNYSKAAWIMEKAVKANPESVEAQFFLAQVISADASLEYDERIYENTSIRTELAFTSSAALEKAYNMDPDNPEIKLTYAVGAIQMPYFVGRINQGIVLLEEMASDPGLSDEYRQEAAFWLGYAMRKKGNAVWMKLIKDYPKAEQIEMIYEEFGLRENKPEKPDGEHVQVSFHLGFMDELAPQTAVWVEDEEGSFVKTLYVSGFSAFAREKQINLYDWSEKSEFETDGTTGASIDWGKHTYVWDLTGGDGKRVKNGNYTVQVEVAWWPSMKYGRTGAEITVGKRSAMVMAGKAPFVPQLEVKYLK